MGILDFLKKKPEKGAGELPPPPPPPSKGSSLELPEAPGLPPLPPLPTGPSTPEAPAPSGPSIPLPPAGAQGTWSTTQPAPSIPTVSGQEEEGPPTLEFPEAASSGEEEASTQEMPELPPLPELDEPVVMEPTVTMPGRVVEGAPIKPMFISIEDYQDILANITAIKDALHDTEGAMNRLNELKNTQERILEDWKTHVEDAERKITYIDQVIFRGE